MRQLDFCWISIGFRLVFNWVYAGFLIGFMLAFSVDALLLILSIKVSSSYNYNLLISSIFGTFGSLVIGSSVLRVILQLFNVW